MSQVHKQVETLSNHSRSSAVTLGNVPFSVVELALHRHTASPWADILLNMLRYRTIDLREFTRLVRVFLGQDTLVIMIRELPRAQADMADLMRLPLAQACVTRLPDTNDLALLPSATEKASDSQVISVDDIRAQLRRHLAATEADRLIEDLRSRQIDMRVLMRHIQESYGMSTVLAFTTGLVTARVAVQEKDFNARSSAARAKAVRRRMARRRPYDPLSTEEGIRKQLHYIVRMVLKDEGPMDDPHLHVRVGQYIEATLEQVREARMNLT